MYGSIQNMDAPVLFFGQLFCDAEPETEMLPVCMGVVCPVEAFEDMRLLFIRDTTAGVGEGAMVWMWIACISNESRTCTGSQN